MYRSFRYFCRRLLNRDKLESELDAELQLHLKAEIAQRVERGESPELARERVLREFGNLGLVAEVTRDSWGFAWLDEAFRDARYAIRTLWKSRLLAMTVILALALGIGGTTAVFSFVNGILLRPLSFPNPRQLTMIWEVSPQTQKPNVVALNNFVAWKERSRSFQSMAAFVQMPMNLLSPQQSEQVPGLGVTSEFFATLATPPLLGRTFRAGEYDRDEPREVILSYSLWKSRFGADPSVIGKRISINVSHHEIIGVMPPGFGIPNVQADLFVPLGITLNDGRNYSVIARLRPGSSVLSARSEVASIATHTAQENPDLNAGWSATVVPLLDQTVRDIRPVLLILFAAIALVLLISCANVANLLLMRSAHRTREISVRLALGAGRIRIVRQLFVENLILALTGGVLGLSLAFGSVRLLQATIPESLNIPRLDGVSVDLQVLAFSAGISILSALLFGLAPILQSTRTDCVRGLHESSRSVTSGSRIREALVVAEVALALTLSSGAGLMIRSFVRLMQVDPGFHTENILTVRMLLLPVRDENFHAQAVNEMLRRIRALPGVMDAGSIGLLPMMGTNSGTWYYRTDRPQPPLASRPGGDVSIVTPGYFQALGIPVLFGRDFNSYDRPGTAQVAILNQAAVRELFPGENPLGKRLKVWWTHSPTVQIVGVVGDIRHSELDSPPDPCLFMPNDQQPFPFSSLVVRTSGDPVRMTAAIREQIRQVDADQGVAEVQTMRQLVRNSVARPQFETVLLSAFGLMALILACLGIYGVIAYSVTQRSRQIGIQIALGATHPLIFREVLGNGLRLTIIGLILGLGLTAMATQFLRSLLFEVQPTDPATLITVACVLTAVSLLACYFPARRATMVDPSVILREE